MCPPSRNNKLSFFLICLIEFTQHSQDFQDLSQKRWENMEKGTSKLQKWFIFCYLVLQRSQANPALWLSQSPKVYNFRGSQFSKSIVYRSQSLLSTGLIDCFLLIQPFPTCGIWDTSFMFRSMMQTRCSLTTISLCSSDN